VSRVHITHHALIRYLERVRGFKFAREIAELQKICAGTTNGHVRLDGHVYEVRNGNLITVTPAGKGPCKTRRAELAAGASA
jgi:hypothetical protein